MASNIQRRRLVLKKNNPACEPTREITRPCRLSKSGQGQSSHNHKQRTGNIHHHCYSNLILNRETNSVSQQA